MSRYFLDANIVLDLIDSDRGSIEQTRSFIKNALLNGDLFATSCDIFTTVYYVASKKLSAKAIVTELEKLLLFVDVLGIDLATIKEAMSLMGENEDFEDLLQYVCALQNGCDTIITNDKKFYQGAVPLLHLQ